MINNTTSSWDVDDNDTSDNRVEAAKELCKRLKSGENGDALIAEACSLALAKDWRVRQEVVFLMPHIPKSRFAWFSECLGDDPNTFVRQAANRVIGERRTVDRKSAATNKATFCTRILSLAMARNLKRLLLGL